MSLSLGICISPMAFFPYECAHESYRNDDTLQYTLPFFVMNRQMNQEERGKENKIWIRLKDDVWEVQDKWENETQTKDKNS